MSVIVGSLSNANSLYEDRERAKFLFMYATNRTITEIEG